MARCRHCRPRTCRRRVVGIAHPAEPVGAVSASEAAPAPAASGWRAATGMSAISTSPDRAAPVGTTAPSSRPHPSSCRRSSASTVRRDRVHGAMPARRPHRPDGVNRADWARTGRAAGRTGGGRPLRWVSGTDRYALGVSTRAPGRTPGSRDDPTVVRRSSRSSCRSRSSTPLRPARGSCPVRPDRPAGRCAHPAGHRRGRPAGLRQDDRVVAMGRAQGSRGCGCPPTSATTIPPFC